MTCCPDLTIFHISGRPDTRLGTWSHTEHGQTAHSKPQMPSLFQRDLFATVDSDGAFPKTDKGLKQ
jgi:hypothetical protein